MDFFKLFGIQPQQEERSLGSLFKTLDAMLTDHSEEEVKLITGFSGLLGRVAYSDGEISDEEIKKIREVMNRETTLGESLFEDILEVVKKHVIELARIEDDRYIQILNATCSREQRLEVIRALFSVAAADEDVTSAEDSEISVIARGLNLSHEDYIAARLEVREHLGLLKETP